jgi:protein SCO1/2
VIAALPDFTLVERDGSLVGLAELAGRPWVANFVFTRCRLVCPMLTARMQELRQRLGPASGVRSVSFSVDPGHDTPAVLAEYARRHGIAGRDWLLLTGPEAELRRLVREGFLLPVEDQPANLDMPVLHSSRFALVDGRGRVRGTYTAGEADALDRLLADLAAVEHEEAALR